MSARKFLYVSKSHGLVYDPNSSNALEVLSILGSYHAGTLKPYIPPFRNKNSERPSIKENMLDFYEIIPPRAQVIFNSRKVLK